MTAAKARGRSAIAALAVLVALLFAGRLAATFLAERWWVAAVAPELSGFVARWQWLGLILELGGIAVAGAWCVGHFLWVVRSIETVQVPRRLGDLEIREVMGGSIFRGAAITAGVVLGLLLGAGGSRSTAMVWQAWHGGSVGLVDPVLGLDLGTYLVQLPFWDAALAFARWLSWAALLGAGCCHFAAGGIRATRGGLAMTDAARLQLGLLLAGLIALAALGEALTPLRIVAGLDRTPLAQLVPMARWGVAIAWAGAAIAIAVWAFRPLPALILIGAILWAGSGLVNLAVAPMASPRAPLPDSLARPVVASAFGLERLAEVQAVGTPQPGTYPSPGTWSPELVARLAEREGARTLAEAPQLVAHRGQLQPVWLVAREGADGADLVAILDDATGPAGSPVSIREGDPESYPGIVSWRTLPPLALRPGRPDTVAAQGEGGIPLGHAFRRLLLAWGTQTVGALSGADPEAALWWRMAPRDRVAHLFPAAWWDEARPVIGAGRLLWVTDGWLTAPGAALAPKVPWEVGGRRYARRGLLGVVDALTGRTRIFLRPDADPLARRLAATTGGGVLPPDSIPTALRSEWPTQRLAQVQSAAVQRGPFGFQRPAETDAGYAGPRAVWTTSGMAFEVPLGRDPGTLGRSADRLDGLFLATASGPQVVRWAEWTGPLRDRGVRAVWRRFASFEQLQDSVTAAGARMIEGAVRFEPGPRGTLVVEPLWSLSAAGVPTMVWVNVALGEQVGAARTYAAAMANLHGESAPVVPAPGPPDPMTEARRWAARADSALRAGDLEGFARAFAALKRVLGTP